MLVVWLAATLALVQASTGGLDDIEHIVIFMQENRAFDHYFGSLRGVRGFADRAATHLPTGRTTFYQPINDTNSNTFMLPFRINTKTTSAICINAPQMDYPVDIAMLNRGRFDRWNTARDPGLGMGHFTREDLDFYYSLADEFTIGDSYHQSTLTQTNPNRLHLFSGSNGMSAGHLPVLDNTELDPGHLWETMGETLEKAGVSWKLYQEKDNFDDNGFAWFKSFKQSKPGSPLFDKGMATVPNIVDAFGADINAGKLPQVSWIVAPARLSEHAAYRPAYGMDLTARLLHHLAANRSVYAKTAFILNYDEQGGFFDHVVPPLPADTSDPLDGKSTVDTSAEIVPLVKTPVGMGFRVPLIVISPWSRGGFVNSEVFDHTSVLRFIERRFGPAARCPNISPWRRAIAGDLTSMFDFTTFNDTFPTLPDTADYIRRADQECSALPHPEVPKVPSFPVQEPGVRRSRPLAYSVNANAQFSQAGVLSLTIINDGGLGAAFHCTDELLLASSSTAKPRKYAVEAGKSLSDDFALARSSYHLRLGGPDGFVRRWAGDSNKSSGLEVVSVISVNATTAAISFLLRNDKAVPAKFTVVDNAYKTGGPWTAAVPAASTAVQNVLVTAASAYWYDLTVTVDQDPSFARQLMGRIHNGKPGTSDPAMARAADLDAITAQF